MSSIRYIPTGKRVSSLADYRGETM